MYTEESQAEQPAAAGGENAVTEGGGNDAAEVSGSSDSQTSSVVEVLMIAGLPMKEAQEFTVILSKDRSSIESKTAKIPVSQENDTAAPQDQVSFEGVIAGEYTLTISGSGYVDYMQTLQVAEGSGLGYRIKLYTGKMPEGMDKGEGHPGLIQWKSLASEDSDNLVDAIEKYEKKAKEKGEDGKPKDFEIDKEDEQFDLNGDKRIDLLDLNYFTEHMGEFDLIHSSVEKFVPIDISKVKLAAESTVSKDAVANLLEKNGETAKLEPKNPSEEISESNPVIVALELDQNQDVSTDAIVVTQPGNSSIDKGTVTVEGTDESGKTVIREIQITDGTAQEAVTKGQGEPNAQSEARAFSFEPNARDGEDTPESDAAKKVLVIDLKGMIAVKKVTFRITATKAAQLAEGEAKLNLAEISTVEFLNGMESRIPEPDMNIPSNLEFAPGNKTFRVSWKRESNVSCYEIRIRPTKDKNGNPIEKNDYDYQRTTKNSLDIITYNKGELTNNVYYEVAVQSLNGEWKSGFCEPKEVMPVPSGPPDRPDGVNVKGGYKNITVSWLSLRHGAPDEFHVFYRSAQESAYHEIEKIPGSAKSYTVSGLDDNTEYFAYVRAYNEKGPSVPSIESKGRTLAGLVPVEMPKYKLINTLNGEGELTEHITGATIGSGGVMKDSPLDGEAAGSALGLFDNNFTSYAYFNDWDLGVAYQGSSKGMHVTLDGDYEIGMITLAAPMDNNPNYIGARIGYWDANDNNKYTYADNVSILRNKSGNRFYYLIKFNKIKTSRLQICIRTYNTRNITVSEVQIHRYDPLEHDILALCKGQLHIELEDGVTGDTIEGLQEKLNTPDDQSGEFHPEKDTLQKELDIARGLWETGGLGDVISVNNSITPSGDGAIKIHGLNAWQPLGISAPAGEDLVVYVGNSSKKDGDSTNLQLVFTQYHSEWNSLSSTVDLKIGRNQITVPQIGSTDSERGGALYVQYKGSRAGTKGAEDYKLRVSGGTEFPVLDVCGVYGNERTERIRTYVEKLSAYVGTMNDDHNKHHQNGKYDTVHYDYNEKECVLNSTDIMMDQMLLSIPASQAFAGTGIKGQDTELRVKALANAIQSMEDMLTLFYQHKGLTNNFEEGTAADIINKNHLPYEHQNIRYMKMFTGAFMYAAGNHIGIEWGSTSGVAGKGEPFKANSDGSYGSGSFFGWGIAHEVGHAIDQDDYEYVEVTNNYFSVLAQARDTSNSVRFNYNNVFKKVTSGAKGYADKMTQVGIYWQLHLAYDEGYNYKTYSTYQDICKNLFFARVDSYARDTARAPAPETALTLTGDRDQRLMRLASAAAEKDLTEFFERWGMTPDVGTRDYMKQFSKETRAIYYGDDDARVKRIQKQVDETISGKDVVSANVDVVSSNKSDVYLEMSLDQSANASSLQGYEITRIYTEAGHEREEVAGFVQSKNENGKESFKDHVPFAANRVLMYKVTAIDKCMNRSIARRATTPVKISGNGLQDNSSWSVSSNMPTVSENTADDTGTDPSGEKYDILGCESQKPLTLERIKDANLNTTFTGKMDTQDPYIILELNQSTEVEALRYILTDPSNGTAITDYKIEVSNDGTTYTTVKTGRFSLTNGSQTVYLEDGKEDAYICTYETSFVKLTAVGQKGKDISVSELELYGPSGDNVELEEIGTLQADYVYDKANQQKIPKDSIIFAGTYKGHPAYNQVVLFDENGRIVGGTAENGDLIAEQIILAPELKSKDALLGYVSEGHWIYWVTPENAKDIKLPEKVRAELYRVDDAIESTGQRQVSDTMFKEVKKELPAIQLNYSVEEKADTNTSE